jgi:ABC-type dipeptide/oligopeptide/nickel transport system permease component
VILASAVYVVINLCTDLLYGVIDPRVSAGGKGESA